MVYNTNRFAKNLYYQRAANKFDAWYKHIWEQNQSEKALDGLRGQLRSAYESYNFIQNEKQGP